MRAIQSTRAEMRETAIRLTHPAHAKPSAPARVSRIAPDIEEETDTHIEPWMELAFKGLTHASETGEPFALVSCFMNGEPAALIAATHTVGSRTHILPLFMAVQPGMHFSPHGDNTGDDDSDEGKAPDRATGAPPEPG
jgi:hypothetical protein